MKPLRHFLVILLFTSSPAFGQTVINAWTSPTSGNWEDPTWSLGILPGSGQTVMITNQGWKAVQITRTTSQNFPETLDVSSVILGGYTDSFNTLLLNFAGFERALNAGSIIVGTNSAITSLSSVLTVSTNSGSGDISIFSAFNQGENAGVNAHTITLGNVTNAAAGSGTYNQTNGTINADALSAWMGSTFNQFGGDIIVGSLALGGGANASNIAHYRIGNGSLTAGSIEFQRGDFIQTGGSVTAGVDIGAATYTLSAGTLHLPGITIPRTTWGPQNPFSGMMALDATLLQTGGTNFCDGLLMVYHEYGAPGIPLPGLGPGRYILSNGVLCVSSTVRSFVGGSFEQWGGWHTNAGTEVSGDTFPNFEIRIGNFTLGGGTLITPSIKLKLGDFTQSGGTNSVTGEVNLGTAGSPATFTLRGGLLTDATTFVDGSNSATPGGQRTVFTQSGGTHMIGNLLRVSGPPPGSYQPMFRVTSYVLSGGVLNVPNIRIDNGTFFEHDGGTLTTSGLLTLGNGAWNERTSGQQFGQLLLSAPAGSNASLSLPSGNCVVRFANSSSVTWSNQARLLIENWNGSPTGGGQHQVFFGSDASGLTVQQLSQIQFHNPAATSGTFPARILATGEIVPDRFLGVTSSGNHLVIQWNSGTLQSAPSVTGPYQDVSGASSPYTVSFTQPQQFFRIRQ